MNSRELTWTGNQAAVSPPPTVNGILLDWESSSGFSSTDREWYTALLKKLEETLSPHNLLLTMAGGGEWASNLVEIKPEAIQYLDWLNIMAYDMGKQTHSTMEDAIFAYNKWKDFGFPSKKLTLGVPFYGRSWSDAKSYANILEEFTVDGPEDDEAGGFYFNGITTIKKKTQMVIDEECLGIMIWELSHDNLNQSNSLLTAIYEVLLATGVSENQINIKKEIFSNSEKPMVFDIKGRSVNKKLHNKMMLAPGQYFIKEKKNEIIKEIRNK